MNLHIDNSRRRTFLPIKSIMRLRYSQLFPGKILIHLDDGRVLEDVNEEYSFSVTDKWKEEGENLFIWEEEVEEARSASVAEPEKGIKWWLSFLTGKKVGTARVTTTYAEKRININVMPISRVRSFSYERGVKGDSSSYKSYMWVGGSFPVSVSYKKEEGEEKGTFAFTLEDGPPHTYVPDIQLVLSNGEMLTLTGISAQSFMMKVVPILFPPEEARHILDIFRGDCRAAHDQAIEDSAL